MRLPDDRRQRTTLRLIRTETLHVSRAARRDERSFFFFFLFSCQSGDREKRNGEEGREAEAEKAIRGIRAVIYAEISESQAHVTGVWKTADATIPSTIRNLFPESEASSEESLLAPAVSSFLYAAVVSLVRLSLRPTPFAPIRLDEDRPGVHQSSIET